MLHDMLRAAAATEDRLIGEAKTARLLRKLPLADLYKFATEGTLGGEEVDGDSWVTRFAGTPLAGAATELATQELELETQIAQNRALGEGVLQQKDQLSIQKRLLDIELVRAQTEEAEKAQAAEAEQQQAAAEQQAPPQADDQAAPPDQPVAGTPPGAEVAPPAAAKVAGQPLTSDVLRGVQRLLPNRGESLGGNVGTAVGGLGGLAHGLQKDEEGKRHWGRGIAEGIGGGIVGGHLGGTVGGTVSRVQGGASLAEGLKGHYSGLGERFQAAYNLGKGTYVPPVGVGAAPDVRASVMRGVKGVGGMDLGPEHLGTAPASSVAKSILSRQTKMAALEIVNKFDAARGKTLGALKKGLAIAHGEYREPRASDENKVAAITEKALDALKKGLAVDHRAVSEAARRHLEDVNAGSKSPGGEKKVAGVLDTARGLVTRGHELVTGSKVRAIEGALEGKVKELGNARDVALHRSAEAEKVLSRGPSIYKGKEILPGPTREARMRAAREVNEHGAAATRLGKEIADTAADTAAAAKTEARKVMGTRVGLVAAPLALGAAAAGTGSPPADPAKVAMVGQAISGLLSHPVAGRVANFAIAHPTAAAGIAGGAVGGVGGALSTDAQGKHSLGRVAAGMAGGAAAGAGIQQAYANRGAISEAAQKAVAGIKAKMAPAAAAAAPAAAEAVPAAAV